VTPPFEGAPGPWRPALIAAATIAVCALLVGCRASAVAPEADRSWARSALVATFTPLAPPSPTPTPLPSATATAPHQTPTPDVFEAAGPIVRLEIPAIGVDASVEKVGRLPNGNMDVPKVPENVAWFTESALPGQTGRTSVVAGHLDSPAGPAVFFNLRRLVPGDELAITYANGDRYVFAVTKKERYTNELIPTDRIFGATPYSELNLITCDGAWDGRAANYQQRLVVYTRLKPA
jgi:sortase (surface protein transpeptidase)